MFLIIKQKGKNPITIEAQPPDTVEVMKQQIFNVTGIQQSNQNLFYHNNLIASNDKIKDWNLEDGDIVKLITDEDLASCIEEKTTFGVNTFKSDVECFEKTDENSEMYFVKNLLLKFETEYPESNVRTMDDVYCLLLITAVTLENINVIKRITSSDHSNILTQTNPIYRSVVSATLESGNRKILKLVQKYINRFITINPKDMVKCGNHTRACILTTMCYPSFDPYLSRREYESLFEPLYSNNKKFYAMLDTFDYIIEEDLVEKQHATENKTKSARK